VVRPITHVIQDFRDTLRNVEANGFTALWDALYLGNQELSEYAKVYPGAKKRLLVLTDGENTSKKYKAHEVCAGLKVRPINALSCVCRIPVSLWTLSLWEK